MLLSYRLQLSPPKAQAAPQTPVAPGTVGSKEQAAKPQGNLVRLLLLQRALNRIMLAFCDNSNACGAVKDGMLLYKRVTIL